MRLGFSLMVKITGCASSGPMPRAYMRVDALSKSRLQPSYGSQDATGSVMMREKSCQNRSTQSWRASWECIVPFFAYPADIQRVIYTTTAIESVNMSLRKIIKNRGSFPTNDSALKLLYLVLQNISRKWTMPIKEWKAALNRFAILFEDRMPVL
jgi:transposase-like protein